MARKIELTGVNPSLPLITAGCTDAPILVVCDSPSKKAYDDGMVMSNAAMRVFAREAEANGFAKEDFAFVSPCPPVPLTVKGSDARESAFLEMYASQFTAILAEHTPKVLVYLGKMAGRQLTRRAVKITKARGAFSVCDHVPCPIFATLGPNQVLMRPEVYDTFQADFRTLKLFSESGYDIATMNAQKEGVGYTWVSDIGDWLASPPANLFVDTEFRNLRWYSSDHKLICIQMSAQVGVSRCMVLSYEYSQKWGMGYTRRQISHHKRQVRELLGNPRVCVAGFNFKIDIHALVNIGIRVARWAVDAQMLAFAVDENMMRKSQSECVRRWVPEMSGYSDAFDEETDKSRMMDTPPDKLLLYAGGDTDSGIRLTRNLLGEVRGDRRQYNVLTTVQMPSLRVFSRMERYGLGIDQAALTELQETICEQEEAEYHDLVRQIPASIRRLHLNDPRMAGKDARDVLSFGRADLLRDILFNHEDGFELTPLVFTKTTRRLPPAQQVASTSSKEHLPYFESDYPFISQLIQYQKLSHMATTYVGKQYDEKKNGPSGFWKYLAGSMDGKIHPSFMLHRTVTGRTASADPNGQNIPKRGKLAKAFRRIFIPTPGYEFVEVDLSQAELRIAAWMANERNMLSIYRNGGDIHCSTAAAVLGVTMAEFTSWKSSDEPVPAAYRRGGFDGDTFGKYYDFKRYQAKAVNFGFLYGMGWRKFKAYAKTDYGINLTDEEAQHMRKVFFSLYPALATWHKNMREFVQTHGYVRSLHGAIRHLPNIYSDDEGIRGECERQAINSPVQRFASDLGLMGMCRFARDTDWESARPVAFIHDAVIIETKLGTGREYAAYLKWYMETIPLEDWFGITPPLPLIADASGGADLSSTSEYAELSAVCPSWFCGHEWESENRMTPVALFS